MQQIRDYGDERTLGFCAFCGGETGTRDHCPSRVFLDEPMPENLPVVPACSHCNESFSLDEEYLACLVSCVLAGSTEPDTISRPKIRRVLERTPSLRARLEDSRFVSERQTTFKVECERVENVIIKLAKGHALYELHESCVHAPDAVSFFPLNALGDTELREFEDLKRGDVWPEVGSRTMQRMVVAGADIYIDDWVVAQPDRYRYATSVGENVDVRIVINEYLGCRVLWA